MSLKSLLALAAVAGFPFAPVLAQSPDSIPHASPPPPPPPPVVPMPTPIQRADQAQMKSSDPRFLPLHQSFLERAKSGPIGVLFLGDSITEYWNRAPEVWKEYYGKYQPANFGISGDRTEHVLWRIENGELDGIKPKVLVLMIGTNNTATSSSEDITSGVKAIVADIQAKLPKTKILLLGIFPRGERSKTTGATQLSEGRMVKIAAVNGELARMDNGATIRYLDLTPLFIAKNGKIPDDVMPDQLHPGPNGYKIWAQGMQPLLDEMMK